MGQKLYISDNFNDIGLNIAFLPPDLRQKSLSRKLHRMTNLCFWIFVMPIGEKIGDGTRSKIKWQPTELCGPDRIVFIRKTERFD